MKEGMFGLVNRTGELSKGETNMIAKRITIVTLLLLAGIVSGCGGTFSSAPPPVPPKGELEANLANPPSWWWSESEFVSAIQLYCAYTDECDTEHVKVGEYGYSLQSYETTVYGETITVDGVLIVHMNPNGNCPEGQEFVAAFTQVTGQGVFDAGGRPIGAFCLEKLQ